jgi:hypothetical protein
VAVAVSASVIEAMAPAVIVATAHLFISLFLRLIG